MFGKREVYGHTLPLVVSFKAASDFIAAVKNTVCSGASYEAQHILAAGQGAV
ncbi:hypothetical protein SDC9_112795 [bioreactor metagenome]|uniref:Uncharacterized protein n=1 Tax=bioreactor metagenome TaxID=1076179 RepID=A0A645BMV9_9ZZZZ